MYPIRMAENVETWKPCLDTRKAHDMKQYHEHPGNCPQNLALTTLLVAVVMWSKSAQKVRKCPYFGDCLRSLCTGALGPVAVHHWLPSQLAVPFQSALRSLVAAAPGAPTATAVREMWVVILDVILKCSQVKRTRSATQDA